MKKYINLITDKYALSITALAVIALVCLMATSKWTALIVVIKLIGLALCWLIARLSNKWGKAGKLQPIKDLFGDPEEMQESEENRLQ